MTEMGVDRRLRICAAASLASVLATGAGAQSGLPPLAQDTRVQAEFLAGAVGEEIAKTCDSLAPRMLVVVRRIMALESHARGLGFTADDIRDLRRSEAARAELRQRRDAYLAAHGAVPDQPETYCRLGHEEMRKGTLIGSLLRVG
jgi:hypothetical protein